MSSPTTTAVDTACDRVVSRVCVNVLLVCHLQAQGLHRQPMSLAAWLRLAAPHGKAFLSSHGAVAHGASRQGGPPMSRGAQGARPPAPRPHVGLGKTVLRFVPFLGDAYRWKKESSDLKLRGKGAHSQSKNDV